MLAVRSGPAASGRARGALRPGTAALQRAEQPVGAHARPAAAVQRARARPRLHPARPLAHRPRQRLALLVASPSPAPHWVRPSSHLNTYIRSSSSLVLVIHIFLEARLFTQLLGLIGYNSYAIVLLILVQENNELRVVGLIRVSKSMF